MHSIAFIITTIFINYKLYEFSLYDGEIDFIDDLLEDDIRNNSAWNQRFFVVSQTAKDGKIRGDILEREFNFVKKAIEKISGNESAWNYLRG